MDVMLFECKGCRKKKEIVKSISGLQYCALCVKKAPKKNQFKEFVNEKLKANRDHEWVNEKASGAWEGH